MQNARCLKLLFISLDVLCICVAVTTSYLIRFDYTALVLNLNDVIWNIVLWIFSIVTVFYILEMYDVFKFKKIIFRNILGILIIGAFFSALSFLLLKFFIGRGLFALQSITVLALTTLWRSGYAYVRHQIEKPLDIFLYCPDYMISKIITNLKADRRVILRNVYKYSAYYESLPSVEDVRKFDNPLVLFLDEPQMTVVMMQRLHQYRFMGIPVKEIVDFYEEMWGKIPVYYLSNRWFVYSRGFVIVHKTFYKGIKRLADIGLSIILLILSFPIMLLTTILIKMESKGAAFYRQERVGLNEKNFTLVKFRSMVKDAENNGAVWAAEDDPRVTMVGRVIRSLRIDELPQLLNILNGEMSFVGPRPERPEFVKELEKEIPYYSYRHFVKPGLTGWAQVIYPYGDSVDDALKKLEYDLFYIKNSSLLLDLQIIFKTIRVVLFREGSR